MATENSTYPRRRKTDDCNHPILPATSGVQVIRPADDPAEAVERIVSRRRLLIERGDVFITMGAASLRASDREWYRLTRAEMGMLPGRYYTFDDAVVAGDELARRDRVRLYCQQSPKHPPQLLKDCRPS